MKNFAVYSLPIGFVCIEHYDSKVVSLQILEGEPSDFGSADSFTDMVYSQLVEYICSERKEFEIEIDITGCSPFQKAVYKELQNIPYGQTRSYKQIATAIGNQKSSRAVGMANNRNPIHIIIPCHRVVGSKGALTGYAAGLETKDFLLRLERG
ncbi:MAG: methylated-DNA--[protein]-cysteine S-methyltransferase [Rikenellaceae bacterium]